MPILLWITEMYPTNRQSSKSHLRPKLKEVVQAHNFFPSYHDILSFNVFFKNHAENRGIDTSFRSNSNSTASTEKRKILVVDDDPDIANLYKLCLEGEGFVVHSFNDPLFALANYKPGEYDLLLFDIKMPHIDGFELYQKIRLVDDRTKVCFISAFEEYHTRFKELFPNLKESDCFIRKPVELGALARKINSRLQGE
jgi:CheY-like chemotaxis protein